MGHVIGIVGGSGLYALEGLENAEEIAVDTPFGAPSDKLVRGTLAGAQLVFLPRHGRGHRLLPTEVPYRANVWALKSLGCSWLVSVSAVGSLREEIVPGHAILVDQYIDRTKFRPETFFGEGFVGHAGFGEPVCATLRGYLKEACLRAGVTAHDGGTYVCMEGPTFSSKAESMLHRSWGASVIGMTAMPEAKLAREAELPYALVAMVTDFDCWHPDHDHVTVDQVVKILNQNADNARALVKLVAPMLGPTRTASPLGIEHVLDTAFITAPEKRDPVLFAKLDAVAGRVLKA